MTSLALLAAGLLVLIGTALAAWFAGRAFGASFERGAQGEGVARLSAEKARAEAVAARVPELEAELRRARAALDEAESRLSDAGARIAELEARWTESEKAAKEKLELLARSETQMKEAFRSLSSDALDKARAAFIDQAQATFGQFREGALKEFAARETSFSQLVAPIKDSLEKFETSVRDLETKRGEAYAGISEQFASLKETQTLLRGETEKLVAALRSPTVRGRWGELQLRRVVEMAGMIEHCDFDEQTTIAARGGEDDRIQRPDLIVHLPGGKTVVVDAKVVLQAYLDAKDAKTDDERRAFMAAHARQLRAHVENLGSKAYWNQLASSPDFVVMYVPLESAFGDALAADPGLLEDAIARNVIPAGPMTLLSLLKGAGYGWRQEKIARSAEAISELGRDLHERLTTVAEHFAAVGDSLGRATMAYNRAVGSLESRVFVSARKFKELGASASEDIPEIETVSVAPRQLAIPGLNDLDESEDEAERGSERRRL